MTVQYMRLQIPRRHVSTTTAIFPVTTPPFGAHEYGPQANVVYTVRASFAMLTFRSIFRRARQAKHVFARYLNREKYEDCRKGNLTTYNVPAIRDPVFVHSPYGRK
jgi:hypothetical protein